MYAYADATIDDETIKSTGFSSGDKLFAFIRGFWHRKSSIFPHNNCLFFKNLFRQGCALVYFDDILFMSLSEAQMLQLIKQLQEFAKKENPKVAPEKSIFMILTVKHPGLEIAFNTIKTIQSRTAATYNIPSPTVKIELMMCVGSVNFFSKQLINLMLIGSICLIYSKTILRFTGTMNWKHCFNKL